MLADTMFQLAVEQIALFTIPAIVVLMVGFGMFRRVNVYESFTTGGKEGFSIFLQILPFLVAIFVAIGLFRDCGALDMLTAPLAVFTEAVGMPRETIPVALMKPLSGSGSLGIVSELLERQPNTFAADVASTMFGSTDTTLYIIALYFGSVGIKKIRHAMAAGLIADAAGIAAAVWICHVVF